MYFEKEKINIVIVVEVGAVEMCINLQVVETKEFLKNSGFFTK